VRSTPESREHIVPVWVDCTLIAPVHVWRPSDRAVWYEVVLPKVFRVGLDLGYNLKIVEGMRVTHQRGLKNFSYMIAGDASSLNGLAAPLDEENTKEKFKLHDPGSCLLTFWCQQPNQDHYTGLALDEQRLEPS